MKRILGTLACLCSMGWVMASNVLVEAESFEKRGGWQVDQQFMDLMGSPYLIAHGMGTPVQDAETSFNAPSTGKYHVYVRTYNWTCKWHKGEGPGAFKVKVNGKSLAATLGTQGDGWMWQYAGTTQLKDGTNKLALVDMKGFDGRCDAVWFTTDRNDVPPTEVSDLETFRRAHGAISASPTEGGSFDMIVVGGGVSGMCAAVSAARMGLKVALVHDRPILGGNNSSEIRVHLGGRIELGTYPALGRMVREFGHDKFGNAMPADNYKDEWKDRFVAGEENVKLFSCYHAVKVNMKNHHQIASVVIRHIYSGEELTIKAPIYTDCTGDGTIGFMAGADWMMGREGRSEFNEALAPEKADKLTMGSSVQWYSVEDKKPVHFPVFEYGMNFNEQTCEQVDHGEWTWETGMNYDQIYDFERIRDYGLLVVYSNWSYLKNRFSGRNQYANRKLEWVAYVAGKRESRRLVGDYILKQEDVEKAVYHEDASFTANWHFDLHFPDPKNTANFPGAEFKAETKSNPIYPYAVPYRCLYSRNINNLFMAGRNISVTHVTLGSVRLMRTTAMMGEVVGMAAAICKAHDVQPREVYQHYLEELKAMMRKGAAKDVDLPDNQHFNEGGNLEKPKNIIFP